MKHRIKQSDNWSTPKEFYNKLDKIYHFTFDPCPLNSKFDGLKLSWKKRNFINPPYNRIIKEQFIIKAFNESKKNKLCVMLLPVSTSSKIFHNIILPYAKIYFIKGRLKFLYNGKYNKKYSTGQHDSMIVIFDGRKNE
jgi:hypothetical protein